MIKLSDFLCQIKSKYFFSKNLMQNFTFQKHSAFIPLRSEFSFVRCLRSWQKEISI